MRQVLGFEPVFTTEQALNELASGLGPGLLETTRSSRWSGWWSAPGAVARPHRGSGDAGSQAPQGSEGTPMADAEIIPLGTRGRPGRGVGKDKPPPTAAAWPAAPARWLLGAATRRGRSAPEPDSATRRPPPRGLPATGDDAGDDRRATPVGPAVDPAAPRSRPDGGRRLPRLADADRAGPTPAAPRAASRSPELLSGRDHAAQRDLRRARGSRSWPQMLAFVRRRVTGDYIIDEFGFDAEVIERFFMAMVRPLRTKLVPRRGAGHREPPHHRRRPRGLQPLRHRAPRRRDDRGGHPRRDRALPASARVPTWSSPCP